MDGPYTIIHKSSKKTKKLSKIIFKNKYLKIMVQSKRNNEKIIPSKSLINDVITPGSFHFNFQIFKFYVKNKNQPT